MLELFIQLCEFIGFMVIHWFFMLPIPDYKLINEEINLEDDYIVINGKSDE